jgi:hypothetical protein
MEIPKQLKDDIWDYCRANNITNIDEFIVKLIRQGFTIEKFGATPIIPGKPNKVTPEIPVEVIEPISLEITENIKKHTATVKKVKNKIEAEVKTINKEISSRDQKNNKIDLYGE